MNHLKNETLIPLRTAALLLPFPVSRQTLFNWVSKGVAGTYLESCRVGGMRLTSREAIERFLMATNNNK